MVVKENENLDLEDFTVTLDEAGLQFTPDLIIRYASALCTKPFVILTGLAGSGKTKLAQAFSEWICENNNYTTSRKFVLGEEIYSNRVIYKVIASDTIAVTFEETETMTKVNLPYELIYQWIQVIEQNNFTKDNISPRKLREMTNEITKFSSQLNSFETHLKAAAFHLLNKKPVGERKHSQHLIIPVGADWTNREPLLGYPNALSEGSYVPPENGTLDLILHAMHDPQRPYFLILDEMNLSHVERYFADFLSAMETGAEISLHAEGGKWAQERVPAKIRLPKNLFIVGTVNIDETTYMFSPKVLDRANVIEFRVTATEMEAYLSERKPLDMAALQGKGSSMATDFVHMAQDKTLTIEEDMIKDVNTTLLSFFKELKEAGAEFGYRSASEILRFVTVVNKIAPEWKADKILDAAVMQKLLPKVHGSRRKLDPILRKLAQLCLSEGHTLNIEKVLSGEFTDEQAKYPISLEKISRMHKSLIENGFTSYAEA